MSAGDFLSALGNLVTGEANAAASEYNAAVARQNAVISAQQGIAAVEAVDRDARRKIGTAIASYGASGVEGGSGSALEVLMDSARMAAFNKLTTKYNYELRGLGYQNTAQLQDMAAEGYATSAMLNAGGSIVNSGVSIPSFGSSSGGSYPRVDASSNQG